MWDVGEGSSVGLGNALRVGNEDDVRERLAAVLCEPDAAAKIDQANVVATQHNDLFDHQYHGRQDLGEIGVMKIAYNEQLHTVDIFNNDTQSLVRPAGEQNKAFGKILNDGQLGEAENLGNALRAGNQLDVTNQIHDIQQQLKNPEVLSNSDFRQVIKDADYIATQHAPWDNWGQDRSGLQTLRIYPNNAVDLINKDDNSIAIPHITQLR